MVNFLAAAPSIIKGAVGAGQLLGSLMSGQNKRPEYKIPDSVRQALAMAKIRATDPYGPGYAQSKDNLDLQTANLIQAAQQSGNAQESIASIQAGLNSGQRDLSAQASQQQYQDEQNLQAQLGQYGQYQDQEWQTNEFQPFQDKAREKRDVFGAGLENVFAGVDDFGVLSSLGLLNKPSNKTAQAAPGMDMDELKKILDFVTKMKIR